MCVYMIVCMCIFFLFFFFRGKGKQRNPENPVRSYSRAWYTLFLDPLSATGPGNAAVRRTGDIRS